MANFYNIMISRGNQKIRLPINPEKLPESKESDNSNYNVLGLGPIMVPRKPKLQVVTISSFFPGRYLPGTELWDGYHEPEYYINFLRKAMDDKAIVDYMPIRSFENGERFATNLTGFNALITKFNVEERGGETGDFYYDLELTEYKDYSPIPYKTDNSIPGSPITAYPEPSRSIPEGQLYVGCTCIANGEYYYTSYGDAPSSAVSGRRVIVSRIVDLSRACPYHITTENGGALGWISGDSLEAVNQNT